MTPSRHELFGLVVEMLGGPLVHAHQRLGDAPAAASQRVLHPRRHLRIDPALNEAAGLELAERAGQHLLRDLSHLVIDLAVAALPAGKQVQHFNRPLAIEQAQDGARPGDHLELGNLPFDHAPSVQPPELSATEATDHAIAMRNHGVTGCPLRSCRCRRSSVDTNSCRSSVRAGWPTSTWPASSTWTAWLR